MKTFSFLTVVLSCVLTLADSAEVPTTTGLDDCNVVWNTPGKSSFDSMPLGNGDVCANVWTESNGDLLFYISKSDAIDGQHKIPKLGRIRVRLEPPLETGTKFSQTLNLSQCSVEVRAQDVFLRIWIDANSPIIRVTGTSQTPRIMHVSAEFLRNPQLVEQPGKLVWYYRNETSDWARNFASQNTPEFVKTVKDPILGRTSGCVVSGKSLQKNSGTELQSKQPETDFDFSILVHTSQPESGEKWVEEALLPVESDWQAHCDYWKNFWNRSWIYVTRCGDSDVHLDQCRFTQVAQGSKAYEGHKTLDARLNAFQISQRYALERYCEAAASRGPIPPQYNGSSFTVDMPAGVLAFDRILGQAISPDQRDWATLTFMWQNTRHPYWSMAARGDFDTLRPGMEFVRQGLETCKDRCRKIFGFDGAFIMEASWMNNVGVFNWESMPPHLRFHQLATIELPLIMCDYYEYTQDERFLSEVLLPCAEAGILYYQNRFPDRDERGKMRMNNVGCAETYQPVDNPCTELGCLKRLTAKLLTYPISNEQRESWTKLHGEIPDVPTRRIRGIDLLAVGDTYAPGRTDCETPELYSVYPFRQVWLGAEGITPKQLADARQSFHVRNISLDGTIDAQPVETGGWQSAPVQAAYLGLAREAARLVSINFNDQFINWNDNVDPNAPFPNRPRPRFPAFWECKMDGTPDNDHGANSVSGLQSMLLLCEGKKIYLLPAWPEDWDVSFKLCAPDNTTVECVYRNGKVASLVVSPSQRTADVIDCATAESRIQTLLTIAKSDKNSRFGLPPMLDGLASGSDEQIRSEHPLIGEWIIQNKDQFGQIDAQADLKEAFSEAIPKTVVSEKEIAFSGVQSFDRVEFTIENPTHRRGEGIPFVLSAQDENGNWREIYRSSVYGLIFSKRFPTATGKAIRLEIDKPVTQFDAFYTKAN